MLLRVFTGVLDANTRRAKCKFWDRNGLGAYLNVSNKYCSLGFLLYFFSFKLSYSSDLTLGQTLKNCCFWSPLKAFYRKYELSGSFESVSEKHGVAIQLRNLFSSTFTRYCFLSLMKTFQQCFLILFSMLYESVDELLWCEHSNETYPAVFSQVLSIKLSTGSNGQVCGWVLSLKSL